MGRINEKQSLLSSKDVAITKISELVDSCKEELEDHRLAINENTTEIVSNSESVSEIYDRLDKLSSRLDELFFLIKGQKTEKPKVSVRPLSSNEKTVFHSMYTLTQQFPAVNYSSLAKHSKLSIDQVKYCISTMIQKGVPLLKRYRANEVFVFIDDSFKELQAKENIVGLTAPLSCWY